MKIAPSLLAADFGHLSEEAEKCEMAGADFLHFDIMDGLFVPNLTFGTLPIRFLRPAAKLVFDVHLMIVQPERYIEDFAKAGADIITVHAEACTHLQRTLAQIRESGARAGLALNPATPLDILEFILDDIDLLLILSVNPGFGGQSFLNTSWRKIAAARHILSQTSRTIELEVDGGVMPENAPELSALGASVLVSGTGVFGHPEGAGGGIKAIRAALS
jgi:ribulose-phosphate 3-epimerase